MRIITLYTTETMTDWECAYLTTQIVGVEQPKPGRFRLLSMGGRLELVHMLGNLPLTPKAGLDAPGALADDSSLATLVIPGGDHYVTGHDRLVEVIGRLVDQEIPVAAICGVTFLLVRGGSLDGRHHTLNATLYLGASGYRSGAHYMETPVVTNRGVTTVSGIHVIPFAAEAMRIGGLVSDAMVDAWEQVFLNAREDNYMAPMEVAAT